ncbi:acyl-CoA dehydrogenase family protein [Spirochaetota bacterium]
MAKNSYFLDEDTQFHFKNTINWKKILPLYEKLSDSFTLEQAVNMYSDTLKELGSIAANELEETAKDTDETGVKMENNEVIYTEGIKNALKAFKEAEALALTVKNEYEGVGMPGLVHMINFEMMCKADPSFMTVYAFYAGVSKTLEEFATEELKKKYIPKLVKGEYSGSMSLTESDAGSDLGAIQTKAEKAGDHFEITGTKIFITNGNGELTLVLAKSKMEEEGTKALSMFLVPRHIEKDGGQVENFKMVRLEHKLGIKGSPTLELSFDKSVGYLVGVEGEGLKQMFYLMNEARLGVSMQALGISQKALEEAKEYAKERKQFGKPIMQHELIADKILDMETDIKAMRSLIYKACEYDDLKVGYKEAAEKAEVTDKTGIEKQHKKYKFLAREMIPLVKYFVCEKSIQLTRDNIQIHGGNGYTTEYPAEMHLRDSVITTIYEGTSQIQSLMAVNDTLRHSGVIPFLSCITNIPKRIKMLFSCYINRNRIRAEIYYNKTVDKMMRPFVISKILGNKKKHAKALSKAMLYAERITRLKAYKTIIQVLADEAKRFKERKAVAKRFIRNYMPDIRKEAKIISCGDTETLNYIKENM